MCQRHIFVLKVCLLTQYLILICKNTNSCIKYKMYYEGWIKYFVIVIVIIIVIVITYEM